MPTAVEWFVERLRYYGVEWLATLCGHGLDPFYHAAKRAGLRLIDTRNEQAAGYMAEAWGRLTRRPGVCAVSSGVAHANAMSGVVNAFFDGAPMLLVSGAGAMRTAGLGHFQDLDQVALAAPVTRFSRTIDVPERVVQMLATAWRRAARGPVHLTFPMDVQVAEVARENLMLAVPEPEEVLPAEDPERVARLLSQASQPLVVAGSGVFYAGAGAALADFCGRFRVPVVTPIWDRGSIDRPLDVFMGVVGAASGAPRLLADADCIVMAGAAPDYRVGFLEPGAVRDDAEIAHLERGWVALRETYEREGGRSHGQWCEEAKRRRDEFRRQVREMGERQAERGLHTLHIIDALREVLPADACLLVDGGSSGQWAHQLLCDRYPSRWLTCGRSGVVGWGLAGAMAARLAFPEAAVVLLSGDGAFTFNVAELESAVRQELNFVAIVADDQGWGITRTGHIRQFGEAIASSLGPIAFDSLAESLGARGLVARRPEDLPVQIGRALAEDGVTVIHVPVVGGHPA